MNKKNRIKYIFFAYAFIFFISGFLAFEAKAGTTTYRGSWKDVQLRSDKSGQTEHSLCYSGNEGASLYNGGSVDLRYLTGTYLPDNYCSIYGEAGEVITNINLLLFFYRESGTGQNVCVWESWDKVADLPVNWEANDVNGECAGWNYTGTSSSQWPNGTLYSGGSIYDPDLTNYNWLNCYGTKADDQDNTWTSFNVYNITGTTTRKDPNQAGYISFVLDHDPDNNLTVEQLLYTRHYTGDHTKRPYLEITCGVYEEEEEEEEEEERQFWIGGGYVIPQSINCFYGNSYCDMVFGYDMGAFSRSISSSTPDLWSYPAFKWWWPNLGAGEPITTSTIRQFIDWGFTDLIVNFTFPTPTSTTNYILELYDPLNGDIGSSTSYVVKVNLITSTSQQQTLATCLGECDEGFFGEIFCGLKKFVCYAFTPSSNSFVVLRSGSEKLKSKFPFSVAFDVLNAFKEGLTQDSDDRTQGFSIPFIEKTATGTNYIMLEVLNASSGEQVLGKDNYILVRKSIVWAIWFIIALSISIILIKNQKR